LTTKLSLPELNLWLLRLAANPSLAEELLKDPLLLYAYYASIEDLVSWPQNVQEELDRYYMCSDAEDLLKMGVALRGKATANVSSEYVSTFLKGEIIFKHYRSQPGEFSRVMAGTLENLEAELGSASTISAVNDTLQELGNLADLSILERQLILVAFALRLSTSFMLFMELAFEDKIRARKLLPIMLNTNLTELTAALSEEGLLAKSGIIPSHVHNKKMQPLSEFWTNILAQDELGQKTSLFFRLVKPFEVKDSSGAVGRIQPEDSAIIKLLLSIDKSEKIATNILMYGAATVNKKAVLNQLLGENVANTWALNASDATDSDLGSLCFFAQRALAKIEGATLVVDKAPSVLSGRKMTQFLFFSFMSEDEDDLKSADEVLLLENPVKTILLTTAAARLAEESLGCFLYHVEIKRGSRAERRLKVKEIIQEQGFSEKLEQELSLQAGLSEQQLRSALTVARITSSGDRLAAETTLLQAVTRSQAALNRREKDDLRIPVTHYSLQYLNTSGKFGAAQIIQALKKRPMGTLCFYGIPGTGKSQLAEYLAGELDKPLLMKRASDLLDKYVGESEKRISEMFAEAEAEEAILLLDEADSFLRDRNQASQQWEVSLVNELLQRMERFSGIFICATNLFKQLDAAALRRFTFKLEFKALTAEQRWNMFLTETGLGTNSRILPSTEALQLKEELNQIEFLTPGDFATVKRQCLLLGEELTYSDWLEQLALEASMKQKAVEERKMGF